MCPAGVLFHLTLTSPPWKPGGTDPGARLARATDPNLRLPVALLVSGAQPLPEQAELGLAALRPGIAGAPR